jgi:hypothetical protein
VRTSATEPKIVVTVDMTVASGTESKIESTDVKTA